MKLKARDHRSDAEAAGRMALEILTKRRETLWRKVFTTDAERIAYVYWAARWAFHWAAKVPADA